MTAVLSQPPELWMHIHRLATEDMEPGGSNDALSESEMRRYLQIARSLVNVCKSWNDMAHELLYENVWVNEGFASLTAALQDAATARRVRRIRLSTTRFDHNAAILRQCPHVEVLVQPEFPRALRMYSDSKMPLPHLSTLRELYWIQSSWSSELLLIVLDAAPNLTHLCLSTSWTIGSDSSWSPTIPALPHLTSLELARLNPIWVRAVLSIDLGSLTCLTIDPVHLRWAEFPELPALRLLALVAPTAISFSAILDRCPNIHELRYDVRSGIERIPDEADSLVALEYVRLRLPTAQFNAKLVEEHFQLLLEPAFSSMRRVVLEGLWVDVVKVQWEVYEGYGRLCDELLERGGWVQVVA
ncbi:hypothetical protein FB45DRAFT_449623 [Roridomyces roridus]|uniref:F-box domain-containing protein n=1 Tax=Roridomyces roridus TaxID=1738132 RepID=A0AAD7C1S2_9AGAR|nr:hypothetical protein FB45DRAFT_449623 [Roridomyces roridus]